MFVSDATIVRPIGRGQPIWLGYAAIGNAYERLPGDEPGRGPKRAAARKGQAGPIHSVPGSRSFSRWFLSNSINSMRKASPARDKGVSLSETTEAVQ